MREAFSTMVLVRPLSSVRVEGPRGPVALLATDPTLYSRLCRYAALGRLTTLTIDVFRDRSEAEQWLTAQAKAMERGEA